jgi:subtilisin family serine protease
VSEDGVKISMKPYSALTLIPAKTKGIHLDCLIDIYIRAQWADEFFERLRRQIHGIVAVGQTDDNRVRIAILDSGIDARHPDMAQYINDGIIIRSQGFPSTLDPLADKDGHGTHGTSVLLKTAPHAALLIARVADDDRRIPDVHNYEEVAKVRHSVP